jgi:transcriptional regulator with XRE-family HTH domain
MNWLTFSKFKIKYMIEKIKQRMIAENITAAKISKKTGIPQQTLSDNLSEKHQFRGENLIKVMVYLGLI